MKGIHVTKTKLFVAIAALELLAEEFAAEPMIRSLIDLCELATTAPDYGAPGHPGGNEYRWADAATDLLVSIFEDDSLVDAEPCTRFEVDAKHGLIVLTRWEARRKKKRRREPQLRDAAAKVRPRLVNRHGAGN